MYTNLKTMRYSSILSALVIFLCFGCGESVEEIWINSDGNGAIHKKIDMSEMISFIKFGMMMNDESDSSEVTADALENLMTREKFDTLIHMESIIEEAAEEMGETYSRLWAREKFITDVGKEINNPDSIWELVEPFLDTKMRARMDMDNDVFDITVMMPVEDFNNLKKLDLSELMKGIGEKAGEDMPFDLGMLSPNIDYKFDVSRKRIEIQVPHQDSISRESDDDMMGMFMGMMGEESGKKLIIYVPGKVKGVNQNAANFKDNRVEYEIDSDRLMDRSDDLNLIIDFKPKRKYRNIAPY